MRLASYIQTREEMEASGMQMEEEMNRQIEAQLRQGATDQRKRWSVQELFERIPSVPPMECALFRPTTQEEKDNFHHKQETEGTFKIVPDRLRELPEVQWEELFFMGPPIDPASGKPKGEKVPQAPTDLMINLLGPKEDMKPKPN